MTRIDDSLLAQVDEIVSTDDGLPFACAASFDNLRVVLKSHLAQRVSALPHRRSEMCAALTAMADC